MSGNQYKKGKPELNGHGKGFKSIFPFCHLILSSVIAGSTYSKSTLQHHLPGRWWNSGGAGVKKSMNQLGLQDLMAASRLNGALPEKVVLFGVVPEQLDWGMELTEPLSEALPQLIRATVYELDSQRVSVQ